jgi:hypothetical protein
VAASLAIVVGVTATSLAGGATVAHATKPVAHAVSARTTGQTTKKPVYAMDTFNASYSGTISILWNTSGLSTATITGTGKGTDFGFARITGSGSSTVASQVDPINGKGTLSGTGETLVLKFATGATATATGSAAPTQVIVSGTATVVSGTGKFAGATGSLKVSGEFSIQSTSGSEHDAFNATLKGTVKVKKVTKK